MQFDIDPLASRAIFKDLMAGKVINSYEFVNGALEPSGKHQDIVNNFDAYRQIYDLLGFNIVCVGQADGFYATRSDTTGEMNEVASQIEVLQLIICRGLAMNGISPNILLDENAGVAEKDLNQFAEFDEINQILSACGLKLPLSLAVDSRLVDRGVMFKNNQGRYCLTSSGKVLFKEIAAGDETLDADAL